MSLHLVLCAAALVAAQTEEPTSQPASPTENPAPSDRAQRVRDAVSSSTSTPPPDALPAQVEPTPPETTPVTTPPVTTEKVPPKKNGFERFIESGPGHYLFYYAPDYASVGVLGGLTLMSFIVPPPVTPRAAFGPSYNPETRDTSEVNQRQYDRLLGGQYREDTVPSVVPAIVGNAALLGIGVITLARDRTFRKIHHFLLGAAQAQLATQLTVELMKSSFGRLRPDFRDRAAHYYCEPGRSVPDGIDCTEVRREAEQPGAHVWISRKEFDDGRRSFPSGHASSAFAAATYYALFVGGEYVWGENATTVSRIPAIFSIVGAFTAAGFVAGTRLTDNRHHPEDVIVGAGVGAAYSAAFYFLHFDLRGRPIVRSVSFTPVAGGNALGFNLRGLF